MASLRNTVVAASLAATGLLGAFNLVEKYEGLVTTAYADPLGIKTICRGTTSGPLLARGKATVDECDAQTVADLKVAQATVTRCFKGPLTAGELAAWTDFTYNVGPGGRGVKDGFCTLKSGRKPKFLRLLETDNSPVTRRAACRQLFDWTQPGTVVHRGLLRRRTDEYAVCIHDLG